MKKYFLIGALILCTGIASAQKSTVLSALDKYKIDHSILEPSIKSVPEDLSFDIKNTSVAADREKVYLAHYDASKPEGSRWTVNSVNGAAPSNADINAFLREHKKPAETGKVDENSMKVESDANGKLVVSYKIEATTLPKEMAFIKDMRTELTINTQTKRLESLHSINEKTLRIKILNVDKMDLTLTYRFDNALNRYLPVKQDLNMGIKLLGQFVATENSTEYSNFKKP